MDQNSGPRTRLWPSNMTICWGTLHWHKQQVKHRSLAPREAAPGDFSPVATNDTCIIACEEPLSTTIKPSLLMIGRSKQQRTSLVSTLAFRWNSPLLHPPHLAGFHQQVRHVQRYRRKHSCPVGSGRAVHHSYLQMTVSGWFWGMERFSSVAELPSFFC